MNRHLSECILAASGEKKPSLVLKHAKVVNVFTSQIETADIAIENGYIVGLGEYEGKEEVDLNGYIVCPGLIDGHIHLESSMVTPREFERAVVPHGTTAVVTDPHEIANVAGKDGIRFMLDQTAGLTLDTYFMLPSCVPSTGLDESGAELTAEDLEEFYQEDRVLGLAELMDSYGTTRADAAILNKITGAVSRGKLIDGHAPGLFGKGVNAYAAAGVMSDHECAGAAEALEKLKRGQWIMIREGTAARNLAGLMELFDEAYYRRCMLVTDDKHPGDLIRLGHIDYIIRKAIEFGADPVHAVIMGSYNAAQYFRLYDRGAVAPGYKADLVIVRDLEHFTVERVYKDGILTAKDGKLLDGAVKSNAEEAGAAVSDLRPLSVYDSFHLKEITGEDLAFKTSGDWERVLCLTKGELTTTERIVPWVEKDGYSPGVDVDQDIVKMAVFERHHNTGHVGLGFLGGYGLKAGAVASSIAHDSHNLMVAGTNDGDMILAGNTVRKNRGGLAVALNGKVVGELALPIAGLMSEEAAEIVDEKLEKLKEETRKLGIQGGIDPFMTLAFTSLPVIPKLRLNTYGLIDTDSQKVTEALLSMYPEKNKSEEN